MEALTMEEETTVMLGLRAITDTLPTTHYRHKLAAKLLAALSENVWLYKNETPSTVGAINDNTKL